MVSTSAWNSRSPCPLPALSCFTATSLPSESTPRCTYPNPPCPGRFASENPPVAKLMQLLQVEYNLQRSVRAEVESLARELESMHAALGKVAQARQDQLDAQVRLWARDAREASYDMEDVLDTFLVRVDGGHQAPDADRGKVKRLLEKMRKLFSLSKLRARHDIAGAIEDIKTQVDEMAKRRDRYRVDHLVTNFVAAPSIDPRLSTLYTESSELIDIDKPRDALINMLCLRDDMSNKRTKIVCVVGSGGLGKTTLAKTVFEKLTLDMGICYNAFIPVGQNPNLKKILRDILIELDRNKYMQQIDKVAMLDERQTIDELRTFLKDKRYFIVIDDIWEVSLWNNIRNALEDNHMESKIIITTRSNDIANKACCSYEIEPLGPVSSKILFHRRIFESEDNCPEQLSELSDRILKKCGGVPLAIVTTASLLANTSQDKNEWQEIYDAIGSGLSSSDDMCNMRNILSLSYYHLPSHMKTCFLYLSIYPEDYKITRDRLIWRWISEGFIKPHNKGDDLFKLGESYFNDLINRSLIQPVCRIDSEGVTHGCRVHDMILDLICSLSKEENFVTILNGTEQNISCGRKPRRLSLKNTPWPEKDVSQVRSIAIFSTSVHSVKSIPCFNLLRVLDLEGCRLEQSDGRCKLNVRNLIHLRYLGLTGTKLRNPPEGIEKLQFLQVLKPGGSYNLPPAIFELRQLMCIESCQVYPRPGNLLRNLASLQVLKSLVVDENSVGALEALGRLTLLRDLHIDIQMGMNHQNLDALINSLSSLRKLQSLQIVRPGKDIDMELDRWALSPQLRTLNMFMLSVSLGGRLPEWINPTSLPLLTVLQIEQLRIVQPEDIQILGMLPALCRLILKVDTYKKVGCVQRFAVSPGAFPCVKWCRLINVATIPSMFPQGAMPKVENITFCLNVSDFIYRSEFDLDADLAMGHLPSLRNVHYDLYYAGTQVPAAVQKVQEALRHAVDVHPNNPSIKFSLCEAPK